VYGGVSGNRQPAALVALLLNRGASPDRVTSYGESALKVASGFALFDIVALLLKAGADRAQLGWSPLMFAVVFGRLEDVRAALEASPDLQAYDPAGRTALHVCLQVGDLDKVRALREAGAALDQGRHDASSPLTFAIRPNRPDALAWLIAEGCDIDAANSYGTTPLMEATEAGATDAVRLLLAVGARVDRTDQFGDQAIAKASRLEIVRLLLAAGADLNAVSDEMRRELFGFQPDTGLTVSREAYLAGRHRRFGSANPEVMDIPFWHAMVRARVAAYTARRSFDDTESYSDPVWCFQRFGRTLTALPDGRYVEIAGEHEDFYDPDFCIYNDVVVYHGDGAFTLYGYPEAVFPPTDFHTATLVGPFIYLIGSLGYQGTRRCGTTPVYRLNWETWQIERVTTRGMPPGWISRHSAVYDIIANRIVVSGGKRNVRRRQRQHSRRVRASRQTSVRQSFVEEYIDNTTTYALDLATMTWRRLRA
jgi:ankyrin repeat protein